MRELVPVPAGYAPGADALAGRVVLVTGAAGGFGSAIATAVAKAGGHVVLLGRKVRALEKLYDEVEKAGGRPPAIYPLNLEGASPADYAELAATIEREYGRLDGIVHAAAHFEGLSPLAHTTSEEILRGVHVNLTAPTLLTQACLPLLLKSPDAAVVFVLDDTARIEKAHWGGYAVAKSGIATLVRVWADELERTPVRVLGIMPGPMRTGLRAKAYFAEDAGAIPVASTYAPAVVFALSGDGAGCRGCIVDARALGQPA